MPIFSLTDDLVFPPPDLADPRGILAVGGDLSPERIVLAYASGIFPWPIEGFPLLWHSPDPRMVLTTDALRVSRSLRKTIRRGTFTVTMDTAFREVITACSHAPRPGQHGTWITDEMLEAYVVVHELGFAHSVEAWSGDALVGGLYGVSLGAAFFGESMFTRVSDASKVAFVTLVRQLGRWDMPLVDCQVYTDHLASLGADEWSREEFLDALGEALEHPTRRGTWRFDESP